MIVSFRAADVKDVEKMKKRLHERIDGIAAGGAGDYTIRIDLNAEDIADLLFKKLLGGS